LNAGASSPFASGRDPLCGFRATHSYNSFKFISNGLSLRKIGKKWCDGSYPELAAWLLGKTPSRRKIGSVLGERRPSAPMLGSVKVTRQILQIGRKRPSRKGSRDARVCTL
jgi:hypothetical protein